jgi:hypothetical protein
VHKNTLQCNLLYKTLVGFDSSRAASIEPPHKLRAQTTSIEPLPTKIS